jgi:hypothetical protein
MLVVIAVVLAMTIFIGHDTSPRLPLAAASLVGYTNVHAADPGWPEGWYAMILVTNVLDTRIDCIVGSYPRNLQNTPVYSTSPAEREVDPHTLPQRVGWSDVPNGEQSEVYMPGDLTVGMRLGKQVTIEPGGSARFSVKLWAMNETLLQVQYRTPTSQLRKWRLALAKDLNIVQSRLLNQRRWVNFRTQDDRPYRGFATVFQPTVTNPESGSEHRHL